MSYYDEDFYMEPCEFEEEIENLKESISKSIQKKFVDEMEALRAENETLREFRDNKEKYEHKLKELEVEYQLKMKDAERKADNKKLKDLLRAFAVTGYRANCEYKIGPKCDRCDKDRKIHFVTPMGRSMEEECNCAKKTSTYCPKKVSLIRFDAEEEIAGVYFEQVRAGKDYDIYSLCADVYDKDKKPFGKISSYYTVFLHEDDCQQYCDWLNELEALKDGNIDRC